MEPDIEMHSEDPNHEIGENQYVTMLQAHLSGLESKLIMGPSIYKQ